MVAPAIAVGATRAAAFARPVVMGGMKKTMQSTARGGARAGSKSAVRSSAGTGTSIQGMLNASTFKDSMSLLETVNQVSGSGSANSSKGVLTDIRDGITRLGTIFSNKISGLNSHLAFRLEKLNTTMTTIGKVLAKDLDLERETFDEMQENERQREREESLGKDGKGEGASGKEEKGLFEKIKGAFGSIIDFLRPDSDIAKVGLAGLFVAATLIFRKQIEKMFTSIFTYLGDLKKAFDEEGMSGVFSKLKDDFVEQIANPSLATMGLMLDKNGKISRIPGSFLDLIDPFTGPTNIFKTLKGLWMGVDPYNDNKPFLPEWMIKPINEFEWYKTLERLMETDYAGMTMDTLKGLWKGEWNGESFLPEWMTMPINEMSWYKSTVGFIDNLSSDTGSVIKDIMKFVDDSMNSVAKFIYNHDTGAILGIDFAKLSDLLPDITEIAKALYFALPKWARFDTELEQRGDENISALKKSGAFDKELYGDSIIDRAKIKEATVDQLRTLLDRESDDLSREDINFITNTINEKVEAEKILKSSISNNESRIIKYESLMKFADAKREMTSSQTYTTIVKNDDNKQITYLDEDNSFVNMRPHGIDGPTAAIEEAMKT